MSAAAKEQMRRIGRHLPVEQLAQFNVANPRRVRFGAIWDVQTYLAAGQSNLSFFNQPGGKQLDETNVITAGRLPAGQSMFVTGAQVLFTPGVLPGRIGANADFDYANDMAAFYGAGLLDVRVGQDTAIQDGPLSLFPGETRLVGDVAYGDNFTADDNKAGVLELVTLGGKTYTDFEPFPILNTQDFTATLRWLKSVVALPSGMDGKVRLRLTGSIYEVKA